MKTPNKENQGKRGGKRERERGRERKHYIEIHIRIYMYIVHTKLQKTKKTKGIQDKRPVLYTLLFVNEL